MLDVNLLRLVARKRQIQPSQFALFFIIEQFFSIEKIGGTVLLSKYQPIKTCRSFKNALLQESTKRGHPRAGPNHNDVRSIILWESKRAGFLHVNRNIFHKSLRLISKKAGGKSGFCPAKR